MSFINQQVTIIVPHGEVAYKRNGNHLTVWVGEKAALAPEDAERATPAEGCMAWAIIGMPEARFTTEYVPQVVQLVE